MKKKADQKPSTGPSLYFLYNSLPIPQRALIQNLFWGRESRRRRHTVRDLCSEQGLAMQDLAMLFFTAVFFALAFLYVKACQKLR
jgi:hypothetical protein